MFEAHMNGARLAYVVRPLSGVVKRTVHTMGKKGEGIKEEEVEQPAGFMVYFPRGHVLRLRDKKMLKFYNLDKAPRIINIEGLSDPNSPLGRLMMAQDEAGRSQGMRDMETMVIQLATAKTGAMLMPEQMARYNAALEGAD